jgi:hypothetical protein
LNLSVLPYSIAFSLSVLVVCDVAGLCKENGNPAGKKVIKSCGLWFLTTLLLPEYGWLLAFFVVPMLGMWMLKNKILAGRIIAGVIITMLSIIVMGQVTQTAGSMGRIQNSVRAHLVSRFVWPNFVEYSFFWPEEIEDTFTLEELMDIARYTEGTSDIFGPILEEKYGLEQAGKIYLKMALTGLKLNSKQVLRETSRDFFSYLCPQAAFQMQIENNKSSLLAWNYGQLQEQAPLLTKYYVKVAFSGWNVMCAASLVIAFARRKNKWDIYNLILPGSMVVMAGWYTMQGAGMQDYKKIMLISWLWLMPVIREWSCTEQKTERSRCEE